MRDKIDEVSEGLIEKSGAVGEKVGPLLEWLLKNAFKITISVFVVILACLVAFGRGIFDPIKQKK